MKFTCWFPLLWLYIKRWPEKFRDPVILIQIKLVDVILSLINSEEHKIITLESTSSWTTVLVVSNTRTVWSSLSSSRLFSISCQSILITFPAATLEEIETYNYCKCLDTEGSLFKLVLVFKSLEQYILKIFCFLFLFLIFSCVLKDNVRWGFYRWSLLNDHLYSYHSNLEGHWISSYDRSSHLKPLQQPYGHVTVICNLPC